MILPCCICIATKSMLMKLGPTEIDIIVSDGGPIEIDSSKLVIDIKINTE